MPYNTLKSVVHEIIELAVTIFTDQIVIDISGIYCPKRNSKLGRSHTLSRVKISMKCLIENCHFMVGSNICHRS